jgi:hypothetical protein
MSNFGKKLIFIILCIWPLFSIVLIGYPIETMQERQIEGLTFSRRCFKVGELKQFLIVFNTIEL